MELSRQSNKPVFLTILIVAVIILVTILFTEDKNSNRLLNVFNRTTSAVNGGPVDTFAASQAPTFNFPNVTYAKSVAADTSIYDSSGKRVQAQVSVVKSSGQGTTVKILDTRQFTPGQYKVEIDMNGRKIDQNFAWGVLAINPDKSIYTPGETANLALAVLDDKGKMVCDAQVSLSITDPNGYTQTATTENKDITVNPECFQKSYTSKPDYETNYKLARGVGRYRMVLTAETKNGTNSITDYLVVAQNVDFDVQRTTATRIFPASMYPVVIIIKANQDFVGQITEVVPNSFNITPLDKTLKYDSIQNHSDDQELIWNIAIKSGRTINLGYTYKAPPVSPQFYLLGPLSMTSGGNTVFEESRQWQIASDAVPKGYRATILSTPSLISYWRLGEASGSTATDQTGVQNGTYVNNGGLTLGATGLIPADSDTAASVSATTVQNEMTVADNNAYHVGSFSYEVWFKRAASNDTAQRDIIGNSTVVLDIGGINPNEIEFYFAGNGSSTDSNVTITDTKVHYLVATYSGGTAKVYLDGKDVTKVISSPPSSLTLSGPFEIGNWSTSSYHVPFNGTLDEVAIYGRALSPQEVINHYAQGSPYAANVLTTQGLVSYWRMGESSGTTAYDYNNYENGTYVNSGGLTLGNSGLLARDPGTAASASAAKVENAMTVTDASAYDVSPFSVEVWFKRAVTNDSNQEDLIYTSAFHINIGGYVVGDNKIDVYIPSQSIDVVSNVAIKDMRIHHLVVTFGSTTKLYLDGQDVSTYPGGSPGPVTNSGNIEIFNSSYGGWVNDFIGELQEVAFYNVVLNQAQVIAHYKAGNPYGGSIFATPGLIGYWRLGESSGQLNDSSGYGNNTTVVNGTPTYGQTGAINGDPDTAVKFAYDSGGATVPDATSLHVSDTWTVEAWVKPASYSDPSTYGWYFGKSSGSNGWGVGLKNDGSVAAYDYASGNTFVVTAASLVPLNQYTYIVVTKNNGLAKVYVNGQQVTNTGTNATIASNSYQVGLGAFGGNTSDTYDGTLDEVAYYNVALSSAQVLAHYYEGMESGPALGINGARMQGLRLN